jgi:hypothetical protein
VCGAKSKKSKVLALPCASHSGEITLSGSRRLHFTLAAAQVLFAHAVVTVAKNIFITQPVGLKRNFTFALYYVCGS